MLKPNQIGAIVACKKENFA